MADTVRQVANTLAAARDEQVAQIVALVDAMQARGAADALIAPLRARLLRLRPARRLRFGRVLFTPLDPVIVAAVSWQERTSTLPRTALEPIEQIVRAGLGFRMSTLEAAIAGTPDGNPPAVARIGEMLWKPASEVLRLAADSPPPPAWTGAGLPPALFHPIRSAITAVLAVASEIEAWCERDPERLPPTAAELEHVLAAALPDGPGACGMLGAVLLTKLPQASADILLALTALGKSNASSAPIPAQHAVDAALGQMDSAVGAEVGAAPLPDAAEAVERAVLLLDGLGRNAGPLRRERLDAVRGALDARSRDRFATTLAHWLTVPTQPSPGEGAPLALTLEASARDLRRFEMAARQLGAAASYDQALRQAAEQVFSMPDSVALTQVDRLRLAEILAGPEHALGLFRTPCRTLLGSEVAFPRPAIACSSAGTGYRPDRSCE